MANNYWMENATQPGRHVLVDCGYVADAKEAYDALRPYLKERNFQWVVRNRLVAHIPRRLVKSVLAAVPQIKDGADYCWCTHSFLSGKEAR